MAIKTLRVFAEYTSTGFVPMPVAGGIDYGYTLANTFPSTQPSTFQTDDPDLDVTVTAMTDFYVWIRISGTAWNPSYTRNVRVYPDSPDINSVVMNMIIATGPAGVSSYSQIVQTANRLYFNGATTDSVYNSKFAGKTYINELNFGTAPQLATVATSGAYADLSGKPALATVATSGSYADLSSKPSGTAPISYNSGTNSFQITQANSTTNGFLTSTDWNTFNNKYLLPSGGTTAQYLRGDGTLATFPTTLDSTRLILNGRNTTGTTLAKGTVVYINGVSGNTPLFARAIASADSTSAQTLGVVEFDIANNATGVVVLVGAVNNLDTSSYTEGVQLYLSGTVAGAFTSSKILAPTHLVYVGIVTRAHPTLGVVEVKIQNGYELDEIHDVQISSPANKDILYRDSATSLWKHASIASVLGYTPYNGTDATIRGLFSATTPISYNSTTGAFSISQANSTTNGYLSSADWTTFNSKQSALTLGNVSEVSSNVLMFPDGGTGKTIGNLTIQVVQSSASTNGYLSSTDWSTFNNKQAALGFTPIQYSSLSASAPLAYNNTTGAFSITQATTSTNGYLSSTDWNTFNSKLGTITLTTTGTSGAATYSAGTLNIPQYQAVLTNPVTGTGTTGHVAYFNGSGSIAGSANHFWDNTNGRLGIGTNTPGAPLSVVGNTSGYTFYSIGRNNADNASVISFRSNSATTEYAWIESGVNSQLDFGTNGNYRMRITSAGNVGIGTSSPGELLHLSKATYPFIKLTETTANTSGQFGYDSPAAEWRLRTLTSTPLTFGTNDTERMRITSGGNVGIGIVPSAWQQFGFQVGNAALACRTALPSLMQLSANQYWDGSNHRYISSNFASIYTQHLGGHSWEVAASGTAGNIISFTSVMTITNGGNILMGTSTDNGERLYVSGAIRATGNITANSDLTLKKNLKLIDNPAEKLMSLNGYSYQWKENDEYQYGVIAQEVEKVMSYAVQTGNNGIKGVAYNQLTPLLIEGFKLHNSEITQLKERVKYLEAKLA